MMFDEDDEDDEEIEVDETLFAFESNFMPSDMTEEEWDRIHKRNAGAERLGPSGLNLRTSSHTSRITGGI